MWRATEFAKLYNPLVTSVRYAYPKYFYDMLRNMPSAEVSNLCNGLTIATESRETRHACVGLFIDAGARYEDQFNNGIAHFFEHMAFRGTCTRPKATLEKLMSCTGARFKCFTTREMVGYFAECLCEDVSLVTDILCDCVFNNSLCFNELEAQRKVLCVEIANHDEDSHEILFDYLHSTAFQGTSLANTVLGYSSNICNFTDQTIMRYLEKNFIPVRTVLAAVGGISHCQMMQLADCYLSQVERTKCVDIDAYRFCGSQVLFRNDDLPMANIAMAFETPSMCDDDNYVLAIASKIIGGWDRSQYGGLDHSNKLAQACAANKCVGYKTFHIKYKDTGLWGVQFMANSIHLDDIMYNIQDQLMKLCTITLNSDIKKAKRQVQTELLTRTKKVATSCVDLGRWILYNGYRPPIHEQLSILEKIDADILKAVCSNYIFDRCPAVAGVGPVEGLPDYTRIRASNYWLRL